MELVLEAGPIAIVVGIPIQMDGSEGEMAAEAREFGRRLGEASGVPVVGWDERLTSARARRSLAEIGRRGKRIRKGEEDMMAAAHLLRGYMDANAETGGVGEHGSGGEGEGGHGRDGSHGSEGEAASETGGDL